MKQRGKETPPKIVRLEFRSAWIDRIIKWKGGIRFLPHILAEMNEQEDKRSCCIGEWNLFS